MSTVRTQLQVIAGVMFGVSGCELPHREHWDPGPSDGRKHDSVPDFIEGCIFKANIFARHHSDGMDRLRIAIRIRSSGCLEVLWGALPPNQVGQLGLMPHVNKCINKDFSIIALRGKSEKLKY